MSATVDSRQDARTAPLPSWVTTVRPHQQTAVAEILDAFEDADVVFLEAPTGAGKTLIAELVRREGARRGLWAGDALYVCSDKHLQDQFLRDFPYARVLKGRSNYPTEHGGDGRDRWGKLLVSAEDCTRQGDSPCWHCSGAEACPYQIAKAEAAWSALAVLNTSYLLAECNSGGSQFGAGARRGLVIVDEADVLEDALMGYVQFEVPQWIGRELGLTWPKKGARRGTIVKWLIETGETARGAANRATGGTGTLTVKDKNRLRGFAAECKRVAEELERDQEALTAEQGGDEDAVSGRWLRDYGTRTFLLKPVIVGPYGARLLWRHGDKFLLMSGTIISADEMADSTGLPLDYTTVNVAMTFPVENRPIVMAPVADITRRSTDDDYADLVYAVEQIARRHAGERVLVHTVSKQLAEMLVARCHLPGRNVCSYDGGGAGGKGRALDDYLSDTNSILFAQSMDRGVDLPGDACRVVVVAKVPFPSFGDRRIAARTRLPGGQTWYAVQTVRKIVQMTGRGVRSKDDHAISYVLDKQFAVNTWAKNRGLLPVWWQEAVDVRADVRWLMRRYAGTDKARVPEVSWRADADH